MDRTADQTPQIYGRGSMDRTADQTEDPVRYLKSNLRKARSSFLLLFSKTKQGVLGLYPLITQNVKQERERENGR